MILLHETILAFLFIYFFQICFCNVLIALFFLNKQSLFLPSKKKSITEFFFTNYLLTKIQNLCSQSLYPVYEGVGDF